MKNLNQILESTFQTLAQTKHKGRKSQYAALVRSAKVSQGTVLDGRLTMRAQSLVEAQLDEMTDEQLAQLHSQIARETQNTGSVTREQIQKQTLFEILQIMAHHFCAEALREG